MSRPEFNLSFIKSPDLERSVGFYKKLLECDFDVHTDHGPRHYGTKLGVVYFEIYPTKNINISPDGIGFSVNNLEEAVKRVGSDYIHKPAESSPFGRFLMLKDPDGRLVHLLEAKKD